MKKRTLILVGFIVLLVAGCNVTPEEFKKAEELCAPFGGLKYYTWTGLPPDDFIRCNNNIGMYPDDL